MANASVSGTRRYGSELVLDAPADGGMVKDVAPSQSLSCTATRPNGSDPDGCYSQNSRSQKELREGESGDGPASWQARSNGTSDSASYLSSNEDSEALDELADEAGSLSLSSLPETSDASERENEHLPQNSCSFNPFSLSRKPSDFHDEYLRPTMCWNERERIRRYQHVARGLRDDPQLAEHLAEIVNLVKDIFGYEVVIIGLVDVDVFTAKVTEGVKESSMPRQESICSHTIHKPPGSVLNIPDMANDWRFRGFPSVKAGLRSYAGVPLTHEPQSDEDKGSVALGSLCIISATLKPALTQGECERLARFAKVIVHAINGVVSRSEQARQRQFRELLSELSSPDADPLTIRDRALHALNLAYPDCRIGLVNAVNGHLALEGEAAVPLNDFQGSLWENQTLVDEWYAAENHERTNGFIPGRTTRATACHVNGDEYLVLATSLIPEIYKRDADVLFLRATASLLAKGVQERLLKEALQSKESFLRDVQHSLRTSLNGVLSASEMLLDDVSSQSSLSPQQSPGFSPTGWLSQGSCGGMSSTVTRARSFGFQSSTTLPLLGESGTPLNPTTHEDLLSIIDSSGRELLTVINSLLGFQSTALMIEPRSEACNLVEIEEEVGDAVLQACSRHRLSRITLICRSELPDQLDTVITDKTLFRQIISALLQNAIDVTDGGTVFMTTRLTGSVNGPQPSALVIEVQDSGCGVAEEHWQAIFEPFFKINPYSSHAGLGLSFAKRYATALGGSVEVAASQIGKGSTFRFTLPNPVMTGSEGIPGAAEQRSLLSGRTFYMAKGPPPRDVVERDLAGNLANFGCGRAAIADDADIIVQDAGSASVSQEDATYLLRPKQVLLRLVSVATARNKTLLLSNSDGEKAGKVVYCYLPLYKKRLLGAIAALTQNLRCVPPGDYSPTASTGSDEGYDDGKRSREELLVMLVDDNEFNLKILENFCRKQKYESIGARDGTEAFETYVRAHKAGRPLTFCAMDLQMPRCGGVESTRLIRQYEKEHGMRPCVIYMITGQSGEEDRRQSLEAGCDGFYVKPIRMKQLEEVVSMHFTR